MKIKDALNILNLSGNITKADIKKAFRNLSLKYHPDRNPAGKEMMQAINAAFDALKDFEAVDASQYDGESYDFSEKLNDALNAIITLAGLEIEICGNWVWVGGNTKEHKDALKGAGFKWAKKKLMWYFRPDDYQSKGRGGWSMDQIRDEHGSQQVKSRTRKQLNA